MPKGKPRSKKHCRQCSRLFLPSAPHVHLCSVRCRLLHRIRIIPWGCWEWTGARARGGYGNIRIPGGTCHAHRASYQIFVGEIPKGLEVCHTFDNPRCINPEHLYLATHAQNMKDAAARNRLPRGEKHYKAKLNEMQVRVIRRLHEMDYGTTRDIGRLFGMSGGTVSAITNRIHWKHLL